MKWVRHIKWSMHFRMYLRREPLNFVLAPKSEQGVLGAARRRSFGPTTTGPK